MEEHLNAPADEGGRRGIERHHMVRLAWASIVAAVVAPPVALFGVLIGLVLALNGNRGHGTAMALSGLTVIGVRVALYV